MTHVPPIQTIDDLLPLARVPITNTAARHWLGDALAGARAIAAGEPRPSPAEHNAPLDAIERATDRLTEALVCELQRHPHVHSDFWRFRAFRPIRADNIKHVEFMPMLKKVRDAARNARVHRLGRPPDRRKQHIVDLALAFCARFAPKPPSGDANNYFHLFAERFFEEATGLSVEKKGQGILRQIRVAVKRLPIEMKRAAHLNKTR